jgi:nicotinamidase-related amidase
MLKPRNLLDVNNSCLLVIDVQERFAPHIVDFEPMVANIAIMLKAAEILKVPVIISEQYVKGLGPTVKALAELTDCPRFEKSCFSVTGANGFDKHLKALGRKQVIVTGIETHVCVNQSVHNLLWRNYRVHVVEDAVGSRTAANKTVGLNKMQMSGALPTTVEMALFELLKESGTAQFKAVQSLVK